MRARWQLLLLACAVAAVFAAGVAAVATSQPAQAQSAPAGPTGGTGADSCPSSNPPNELVLVDGTPQTAPLETGFANPLEVQLANTNGCPITTAVGGTPVTFTAPTAGPSATFGASGSNTLTVGSDAAGNASVQMLSADDTAGSYAVTASSAYGAVSFALTNAAAGIPATIAPLPPASEHATVNSRYDEPLAVRVLDVNGNPVVGASVTFSLGSGGGGAGSTAAAGASFDDGATQATETTDADGIATSPRFGANAASGSFTATATVAHVTEPARFTLGNLAAKAPTLTPAGPSSASATVGTRYAHSLRVTVRDSSGNPVAGVTVRFTLGATAAGGTGASATFTGGATAATATTGRRGVATSPRLAANTVAGSFTATASAAGALRLFELHNRAGSPSKITAGVGAVQSTATGTRFAIPLSVTVTDAHGNEVPDAAVTFAAPSSGTGGTFPGGETKVTVRTNSSGIARAPAFTANRQAGGYIVTATAGGARPVAFALVNTAT